MLEFITLLNIKESLFFAGFAGAFSSYAGERRKTWWGLSMLFSNALGGNYLAPFIVAELIKSQDKSYEVMVSFLVGLVGVFAIRSYIKDKYETK